MKNFFLFFLLLAGQFAAAQAIDVSGTVKDDEGQFLHFAFVKDVQSKSAAYTDSVGNFTINVSPNSSLYINCFGFKDTLIKIDGKTTINVVMRSAVTITASKTSTKQDINSNIGFQQLGASMARDNLAIPGESIKPTLVAVPMAVVNGNLPIPMVAVARVTPFDAAPGAIFPQFNPKGETEGSRYLFKGWVHGYVINSKDTTIQNPVYMFEYDKMGGGLLLTKNQVSAIEINRDVVKSFTLYDNINTPYSFENVPQINATHYVQVLASGDKYKIYKAIKTTFEKDNYATDGVFEQGHNYDLYKDEYSYYVYDVKTNALQKVALKKKILKDAFAKDADKLNKFISDHSSDRVDDFYLANLGAYMNE